MANCTIDFYLTQVSQRVSEKRRILEDTLEKAEKVRANSDAIAHFTSKWDKFDIRVSDFRKEIDNMERKIAEKQEEIEKNRKFSTRENLHLTKLFEKFEKLNEDRKMKEQRLLKMMEEDQKPDSEDEIDN